MKFACVIFGQEIQYSRGQQFTTRFKTLSRYPLRIFQRHDILVQIRDTQSKNLIKQYEFFGANMAGYDMILGLLWLIVLKAYVAWETGEFYFFSDTPFALSVQEVPANGATKVGISDSDTIGAVAD